MAPKKQHIVEYRGKKKKVKSSKKTEEIVTPSADSVAKEEVLNGDEKPAIVCTTESTIDAMFQHLKTPLEETGTEYSLEIKGSKKLDEMHLWLGGDSTQMFKVIKESDCSAEYHNKTKKELVEPVHLLKTRLKDLVGQCKEVEKQHNDNVEKLRNVMEKMKLLEQQVQLMKIILEREEETVQDDNEMWMSKPTEYNMMESCQIDEKNEKCKEKEQLEEENAHLKTENEELRLALRKETEQEEEEENAEANDF